MMPRTAAAVLVAAAVGSMILLFSATAVDCAAVVSRRDGGAWAAGLPPYGAAPRHHPITFSNGAAGYLFAGISGEFDMWRFTPGPGASDVATDADTAACAWACRTCAAGGGPGGAALTVDGVCVDHCSSGGYCGTGAAYRATGSTDCRGCATKRRVNTVSGAAASWSKLAVVGPKPSWRTYSYGVAIGHTAFMGFGKGAGGTLRDWWAFDTRTNTFAELAPLPDAGKARWHPAMVTVQADRGQGAGPEWFVYVGCGGSDAGNLRDWWEYSVRRNTWTRRADLPGPARHHPYYWDATTSDGAHYAYVGFGHGAFSEGYIFRDVWRFDPVALAWARMRDAPFEGRVAGTQFSHTYHPGGLKSSRGYVLSGDGDDHGPLQTGEFWEYNPDADSWLQLPPHPGRSRWAPGCFVVGCTLYLTSGYDRGSGALFNDIVAYPLSRCTAAPTATAAPSATPSIAPTNTPTNTPTEVPSVGPTMTPTMTPTARPTARPTEAPTTTTTAVVTVAPTSTPSTADGVTAAPLAAPATAEPTDDSWSSAGTTDMQRYALTFTMGFWLLGSMIYGLFTC